MRTHGWEGHAAVSEEQGSLWVLLCGPTGAPHLSVPWLCSCKNSLASYKSLRHHHCLQSRWCSIRERKSIIMPLKTNVPVLPTLQQGTPRVPRAGTSGAPFFFSLQCEQGMFMPRRKWPCACIYKGLRFSNQVYCKKECRESWFAEMGSEEMRTSEKQTEWGTEIVALSCLWKRIIRIISRKNRIVRSQRNSLQLK